ncbi:MAG: DinB family protein [Bacteroidota bacterium]
MDAQTQAILEKIDRELRSLLREMGTHSNEVLNQKPRNDAWSVNHVIQHLMRAEDLSTKYVQKKLHFNPILKETSFSAKWRTSMMNIFLKLPFKFKAPKLVSEEYFEENADFDQLAATWRENRADLRAFLETLPDNIWKKEVYKHPIAGRLPLSGMLQFYDAHFNRHRKQIYKTLRLISSPILQQ